jgi:hypothetical protein
MPLVFCLQFRGWSDTMTLLQYFELTGIPAHLIRSSRSQGQPHHDPPNANLRLFSRSSSLDASQMGREKAQIRARR